MYSLDLEVCSTKLVLEHDILLKELPYVKRHRGTLCVWEVEALEEVRWLSTWMGRTACVVLLGCLSLVGSTRSQSTRNRVGLLEDACSGLLKPTGKWKDCFQLWFKCDRCICLLKCGSFLDLIK